MSDDLKAGIRRLMREIVASEPRRVDTYYANGAAGAEMARKAFPYLNVKICEPIPEEVAKTTVAFGTAFVTPDGEVLSPLDILPTQGKE